MAKVFGWYDNEWGYSCRLVDLMGKPALMRFSQARLLGRRLRGRRSASTGTRSGFADALRRRVERLRLVRHRLRLASPSSSGAARPRSSSCVRPATRPLLVLEVDDVDAGDRPARRSHVVRAPVDQPDWGGRVAFLRDPSGNLIELFQSLPQQE